MTRTGITATLQACFAQSSNCVRLMSLQKFITAGITQQLWLEENRLQLLNYSIMVIINFQVFKIKRSFQDATKTWSN